MVLPTGNQLRAARALAGLKATELARLAKIDASTISRLESARHKNVHGMAQTVDAVVQALNRKGVRIVNDETQTAVVLKKSRR
jgi:transcriptional regulator with XRE-family HTH domain